MARPSIKPRTSDLRVRCPTDCATQTGFQRGVIPYKMYGQLWFLFSACPLMILYICTKIRENNQRVSQLLNDTISIVKISKGHKSVARMVVQGKLVEPAICFGHLYACEALIHHLLDRCQTTLCLDSKLFFFNIYKPKI